jgi:L-malate glycosyltransferase
MMNDQNKPFIVPAGDDKSFTEALIKLATDKELRISLGKINKQHVYKTYDQSRMFDAYAKVWNV